MKRPIKTSAAALFVLLVLACPAAWADITLDPVIANVTGSSLSAPGFGTGSWQASATLNGEKSELYLPPSLLFGHSVTISDIASISYWTDNPVADSSTDWGLLIYTVAQPGDTSWYHSRLNAEPYLTGAGDAANTWTQWSTNDPSNPLRFYDANRDGGIYGTYTDPTLATIQGTTTLTWPGSPSTSLNYNPEQILYFSWQTGSAWANGFTGLIDGLDITLKDGEDAKVNLEAPEASSVVLLAMMLGIVGLGVRTLSSAWPK
jgi:hypothetical protein